MSPLAYSLSLQVSILIPFSAPETGNRKTGNRNTGNSTGPSGLAAPETEMVAPLHVEVPKFAPKPEPDME